MLTATHTYTYNVSLKIRSSVRLSQRHTHTCMNTVHVWFLCFFSLGFNYVLFWTTAQFADWTSYDHEINSFPLTSLSTRELRQNVLHFCKISMTLPPNASRFSFAKVPDNSSSSSTQEKITSVINVVTQPKKGCFRSNTVSVWMWSRFSP